MRYGKLLILLLALTSISLTLSLFALIFSYGAYMEINRISPYVQTPTAAHTRSTAPFPSPFAGAFVLLTSPVSLALVFLMLIGLFIFVFRR
jgi:hypothetical protein